MTTTETTLAPALTLLIILGMLGPAAPSDSALPPGAEATLRADADGDDVPDAHDNCPETRPGYPVETNGCAKDSDGDGVADGADRCADTHRGEDVDHSGCSVRDLKLERAFPYLLGVG